MAEAGLAAAPGGGLVLYQGEPGAYSEEAARKLFPKADPSGRATFAAVFADLGPGATAVLPVENSLGGVVQEVSDLLWTHPKVSVVGEHIAPIRHHLLARRPGRVERALSHPQALAQCAGWLAARGIEPVPFPDTAGAAREVAEGSREGEAAIASSAAALRYGLEVLASDIADQPSNRTRFLVCRVGRTDLGPVPGDSKLSLGFATAHRPGALAAVLDACAGHHLNLSRLDSRPVPELPFHYRFYADLELPAGLDPGPLLEDLARLTAELRPFGLYPRAVAPSGEG